MRGTAQAMEHGSFDALTLGSPRSSAAEGKRAIVLGSDGVDQAFDGDRGSPATTCPRRSGWRAPTT